MLRFQIILNRQRPFQISTLTAEHLRQIRALQEKLVTTENDYLKIVDQFRTKNQELLRKIAQLSKGKVWGGF